MLLAIDTATRVASLALYSEGAVLSEHTWVSQNNHTVELVPNIARLLEGQRATPQALTGLAVALGPGSFTGLRIGLSVAKGFALGLGIPLVGIPTLDVLAYAHAPWGLPIWAILQAGRGRICAAFYPREGPPPRPADYLLTTLAELEVEGDEALLFCGEIDPQGAELLRQRVGDRAVIAPPAASLRRAGYLAELAWERLRRGEEDDLATLSPIYLHRPRIGEGP
ncbi:MAG TPA: tRNA (adenosine(37)-N6)-threonylcarbamoyltransferase complex dimerization subunit type 1 TsaB [Anaerolineae bacterium]|nr:tRNA (adenosine(37)-N6)-threonylcarbamoyltransferase complex dimerization subunit type 1 TsaB [Anaerolineae bacterium]